MTLIYLASTRCDLTTELLLIAHKLPMDKLLLFFSHLQPISLSKHIAENEPQLKEMFIRFKSLFGPNIRNTIKPSLPQVSHSKPGSHSLSAGIEEGGSIVEKATQAGNGEETMECTRSLQPQALSVPAANYLNLSTGVKDKQHLNYTQRSSKVSLSNKSATPSPKISSSHQEERGRKGGLILITNVERKKPSKCGSKPPFTQIRGTEYTSRVVVQALHTCENCKDGTCPRCTQVHSTPLKNSVKSNC